MIGFIFCHGWSYTPSFWNHLKLSFQQSPTVMWNLGYYQDHISKLLPQEIADMDWIGIGHSLGFAKLLSSGFPFKGLVGLQAFSHFLGRDACLRARREKEYLFFKKRFQAAPLEQVLDYHQFSNAMLSRKYYESLSQKRLSRDLDALWMDYTCLLKDLAIPTLILGAKGDTVVPPALLQDNFSPYPFVRQRIHPSKGHALGYHHADWVASQVQSFLEETCEVPPQLFSIQPASTNLTCPRTG